MDQDLQLYKIVLIGNSGTGKTNITTKYIKGEFYEDLQSTVGVQFFSKTINIRGKEVKVTLWDTAGQERFKSLSKVYYKGARGILAVYDITDPQSYIDIQSWLRLANETVDLSEITVFVVGNKIDLNNDRKVTYSRALKEYKEQFDIAVWEVSAKTGENINQMFQSMYENIYLKGIEVKNSVVYPQSQVGSYSEIRESFGAPVPAPREMKPLGEVIVEQSEDARSSIKGSGIMNAIPKKIPTYANSRMTLTNADQNQRIAQNNNKKRCCH